MKAACYCRVSTSKTEQLESMDKQIEFFETFVKEKGYDLYNIYADEGITGKQLKNRFQFAKMMQDARLKKFEVIFIKEISRMARNTVDFLVSIRELKKIGVVVYFVTMGMDTQESSETYLTILAAMAQEESARMSMRLKFGKNVTAKKGRVPNFVFGYDRVDNYTLAPNEYEANIIRKIFSMYVNDGIGTAKISDYLTENNVVTKKNNQKNWTQNTVAKMLRNEIYAGKVVNHKSRIVDFLTGQRISCPEDEQCVMEKPEFRVIDQDIFDKAQAILNSRVDSFHKGSRVSVKYPLSNLIYCGECGKPFRRCRRQYKEGAKEYIWWACGLRNSKGVTACINSSLVYEDYLTDKIMQFFNYMSLNKKTIKSIILKEINRNIDEKNSGRVISKVDLEKELSNLNRQKEKYMNMYKNEIIDMEELKSYTNSINDNIKEMKKIIQSNFENDITKEDIEKYISSYFENIFTKKMQILNNTNLKEILQKITVYQDKITLTLNLKISEQPYSIEMPLSDE